MKKPTRAPLIRLPIEAYRSLKAMSKETGRRMSDLAAQAIDRFQRERFLEAANREYARWTPAQRREYQGELAEWDVTLMDGLEPEDWEEERRAQAAETAAPRRRMVGRSRARTRS